jgi:Arc/MetJ family transcription regulator
MPKTLVDIPDELLEQAKDALGTATKRETVIRSMQEVIALRAARRHAERLLGMEGWDLDDPEVMREAWG